VQASLAKTLRFNDRWAKIGSYTLSKELKHVYLNSFHKINKAKFVPFAGYSMPINYELGILKEHLHVRSSVGVFDVSHMGQIIINTSNKNILSLEKYIPLNLTNLILNKSYYSYLLNNEGGFIDDLIISKILYNNIEFFYIVYNAGRKTQDEKIFKEILCEYHFLNDNSLLAIQGPNSEKALSFLNDIKNFLFMQSFERKFSNNKIIISRSGYSGEDGFEISIPNVVVLEFLNLLLLNKDVKLCGLGSRDSLRLEAGLSLYGNELNENITPVEAGLVWAINKSRLLDKNLNGYNKILNLINGEPKIIKVGLRPLTRIILRPNMKLLNGENMEIGHITSGGFSPTLNSSIAIAYINKKFDQQDAKVFCKIRDKIEELKIVDLPFVLHKYKRGKL
tara:strand:- start:274 stop:1452 length:1179 start_codon:yes stop_codon:yes gene_type:complete